MLTSRWMRTIKRLFYPTAQGQKGEASHQEWQAGIAEEVAFWDHWLASRGGQWNADYEFRLDPKADLQQHIIEVLPRPATGRLTVLDVGAGPLTYLGKRWETYDLEITAIDPLADEYQRLFRKHGVTPPVHTQTGYAERLVEQFGENRFDLVHARNCIDHSYDPALAIEQMVAVTKAGGMVYMHHAVNEAVQQQYHGFHQWNLYAQAGELYVSNQAQTINMNERLAPVAAVETQLFSEGIWMINLIRKYT